MGEPVHRRQTADRLEITAAETDRAAAENGRAALAYLLWPVAAYDLYVVRAPSSAWYREQLFQALRFGLWSTLFGAVALLWPLVIALAVPSVGVVILLYAVAIVIDLALLSAWLLAALRYAARARRGERFSAGPRLRSGTRRVFAKR